jgi:hypothetical protein
MLLKLYLESSFILEEDDEEVKLTKKQIQELAKEWAFLERQAAVMNIITKKIASRVDQIQSQLLPVVKKEEAKSMTVKHAMLEYTTRKTTSVKYQKAFERALELVNDEQKKFLEEYKETVTTRGVIENVKLVDPKLAQVLNELQTLDITSLIELLPRVKNIEESVGRSVAEIQQEISSLMQKALTADRKFMPEINTRLGQLQKEKRIALDREFEEKKLKEASATDRVKGAISKLVEIFLAKLKSLTRTQKSSIMAVDQLEEAASAE